MIIFAKFIDNERGTFTMSADGDQCVVNHYQQGEITTLYTGDNAQALVVFNEQLNSSSPVTPVASPVEVHEDYSSVE